MKTLYYSLFHSHLNYGINAWGTSRNIKQIEVKQKRAIRIINRRKFRAHTDPLFKHENILKVHDLYKSQACLFVFDCINDNLPVSFVDYFSRVEHPNPRRPHDLRNPHISRTTFSSRLPPHNYVSLWNSLSDILKSTPKRNQFKNILKRDLIDGYHSVVLCNNPRCSACGNV